MFTVIISIGGTVYNLRNFKASFFMKIIYRILSQIERNWRNKSHISYPYMRKCMLATRRMNMPPNSLIRISAIGLVSYPKLRQHIF